MLDNAILYDAIYGLAADDGCGQALFGNCAPLAHEAFLRSCIGDEFPLLWFEVPLAGEPRFDLHVAISREALRSGVQFPPGAGNGYDELFAWYAEEERGGGGLAFAYDVSEGRIDNPAVHVNVNNAPLDDMGRFFDLAAGSGAAARYTGFVDRLPQDWRVWYAGVHPGRPGAPVRVDCFVGDATQRAYAADFALFERDLDACGFTAMDPALRDLALPILQSPFNLELQFDVMNDGTLGPTLGISAGFLLGAPQASRALFEESGAAAELFAAIERLGLADSRWRHIPDATFATLAPLGDAAVALYCVLMFAKLRLRDGQPLDAKVYLQAGGKILA